MPVSRREKRKARIEGPSLSWSILYSAIITVAILLIVELALRAAGVTPIIQREDPTRGFSGLVSVYVRDGEVYRTRELPDQQTFNEQQFLVSKPDNGYRIFSLGGSSTYGFPWGAEAVFTAVLGDVLSAAHPGRTIEAVNAGGTS